MRALERKLQARVRALHITAAKLLLALGTHIVVPKAPAEKTGAGQDRLAYADFVKRLDDVSANFTVTKNIFES